jgi:hypothetical protein
LPLGLLCFAAETFAQPVTTLSNAELFSRQYAQADTARNDLNEPIVSLSNKTVSKKKINGWAIPKTMLGGIAGETVGALAFGGIAFMGGLYSSGSSNNYWSTLFTAIVFAGGGAAVGCSYGVHKVGKKYKRGSFWTAMEGALVPPLAAALIASIISKDTQLPSQVAQITFALAPVTSTAYYFIYSDDLPDTVKAP